jgi:hypothetical protein
MSIKNKSCLDCNKKILSASTRCNSCAQKERFKDGAWNKGIKRYWDSPTQWKKGEIPKGSILFEKKQSPWNKGKPYFQLRGENHFNWKGGITELNHKIRTSLEYKLWRIAVFERDNYTCQGCKKRGSTEIHADHIKPFSLYPNLRFVPNNGRTLCIDCHKNTDTYGGRIQKWA